MAKEQHKVMKLKLRLFNKSEMTLQHTLHIYFYIFNRSREALLLHFFYCSISTVVSQSVRVMNEDVRLVFKGLHTMMKLL